MRLADLGLDLPISNAAEKCRGAYGFGDGRPDPGEGGFHVLMMDGRVMFIESNINPTTFRRLVQYADGERLDAR